MSRNKYSSFRTAERVSKTLFKANVTVLLLALINNVNISRLNRIGRQLQPVELAAGELAVNWQTTSAWWIRISDTKTWIRKKKNGQKWSLRTRSPSIAVSVWKGLESILSVLSYVHFWMWINSVYKRCRFRMSTCNSGFAEPRPLTQFVLNDKDKLFLSHVG